MGSLKTLKFLVLVYMYKLATMSCLERSTGYKQTKSVQNAHISIVVVDTIDLESFVKLKFHSSKASFLWIYFAFQLL